jgi:hypothetical protein
MYDMMVRKKMTKLDSDEGTAALADLRMDGEQYV